MKLQERLREGLARTRDKLARSLGLAHGAAEANWEELEEALLGADVGVAATRDLLAAARAAAGANVREVIREKLLAIFREAEAPVAAGARSRPEVVLIVGVNGVGKTTTIAKLAHRSVQEGRRVLIVAADTFRAAAIEQLEAWAKRAGVDLVRAKEGADPAAVVHDGIRAAETRGVDQVLIDTAGLLHTRVPLMAELAKLRRVAKKLVPDAPHQTLLVMDATVGGNGLQQARHFQDALALDGIILTKLDGTARGGIAVAVAKELRLPVRFAGVGEGLEDLVPFSKEEFVGALI